MTCFLSFVRKLYAYCVAFSSNKHTHTHTHIYIYMSYSKVNKLLHCKNNLSEKNPPSISKGSLLRSTPSFNILRNGPPGRGTNWPTWQVPGGPVLPTYSRLDVGRKEDFDPLADGEYGKRSSVEGRVVYDAAPDKRHVLSIGNRRQLVHEHSNVGRLRPNGNRHCHRQSVERRSDGLLVAVVCQAQSAAAHTHQRVRRRSHSGHLLRAERLTRDPDAEQVASRGQRSVPVSLVEFHRHSPAARVRDGLAGKRCRREAPRREVLAWNARDELGGL